MNTNTVPGLASIIVPCFNEWEFTRACLQSLFRYNRPPWELIVVDNGSTDDTACYLAGVQDATAVPVTVVANATNRGFPAAINQGLQVARGEYLVLLNNDAVVTESWLDQLIALVNAKNHSSADTAEIAETEDGQVRRFDFTAEAAETTTEREKRNRTIIDFDELRAETATSPTRGPLPSPPLAPPSQGGENICSPSESEVRAEIANSSTRGALPSPPLGGAFTPPGDPALAVHPALAPPSQGGESMFASERIALLAAKTPRGPERVGSTIGLVGPMSNYAAPPQLVEKVPYRDVEQMHHFARRWRDEHRGKWFTVPKLSGFCLLVKRAVYDKIGGLDERFGLGLFDDDDLAERARRAGFELAVAHDLFIHHFGSRTFAGNGIDAETLLDENARRFADKWGLPQTRGRRVALRPFTARPQMTQDRAEDESGPRMTKLNGDENTTVRIARDCHAKVKVSLTMIVRDEENNLPHCLESVAGLFDEIVVVDTGSTDRTVEIARSFGARVFDFVWVDDFSAARNAALARATGDYAFWLDADDVVDPPERAKLEALLDRLRAGDGDGACYVVRCKCDPSPDGSGGDTVVDHIRLFPVRENVRWKYRVHEQILPALKRAGVPVRWTGINVRHTGYTDPVLRAKKLDRDTRLLWMDLEELPGDPFVLFNLGSIAIERKEWYEALGFLHRSLAGSAPTDSITRKLFALIARAHQMREDTHLALRACAQGLALDTQDAELWFRKAVVHRQRGESAQAEDCWRRILTLSRPDQFSSFDQGIYGHLTRRNLAVLAAERGDHAEAVKLWTEVLAECPGDRDALKMLQRLGELPSQCGPQADKVLQRHQHAHVTQYAEQHSGHVAGDLPEVVAGSRPVHPALEYDQAADQQEQ